MIGMTVKTKFTPKLLVAAKDKAAFRNIGHAAASLAKDAKASIQRGPKEQRTRAKSRSGKKVARARHAPSTPGTPPHTQRGRLPAAIRFAATENSAVIGPRKSVIGEAAAAHELGGSYKGQHYPARPFMQPALERAAPRFAGSFRGSIGG